MAYPPPPPRAAPPEPTEAVLHESATSYVSHYGATQASVLRILDRKIDRWAAAGGDPEQVAAYRLVARRIVAKLAETGAINDGAFAASRAKSLQKAGKSARMISAHLAAKGVPGEVAADIGPADEQEELAAAVIHVRKKRLGAFRTRPDDEDTRRRELANMARAGFAHNVARSALRMSQPEAEALIERFRAEL